MWKLSAGCRYSDCAHESEPGCAVRQAVEEGVLARGRLESYLKLRKEAGLARAEAGRPGRAEGEKPLAVDHPGYRRKKEERRGDEEVPPPGDPHRHSAGGRDVSRKVQTPLHRSPPNPHGIQWMRYDEDCPLPDLVRRLPHVAFEVDDLEAALEGQEVQKSGSSEMFPLIPY